MCTPGTVARIFIDGRTLHIKRLLGKFKQRANVPYPYHCKKGVPYQRTVSIPEVESRTQGSRPRPRTQQNSEAKAKDTLSEDRHSRGQGQECSRPRTKDTAASVLKKKFSKKLFRRSPIHRRTQNF